MNNPAFPVVTAKAYHTGMNLRDYFAIHAPEPDENDLQSERRRDQTKNPHNDPHKPRIRSDLEIRTQLRYEYADAMMKARGKHE